MITGEMLDVYERYLGNPDAMDFCGSEEERQVISGSGRAIAELVQDLILVSRVPTTSSFVERLERRLHQVAADEEVIRRLREIAMKISGGGAGRSPSE